MKVGYLTGKAISCFDKGKYGAAIDHYIKAFNYCSDDVTKASLVEDISNVYWKMGKLEDALKYATGAQAVYERLAAEDDNEHYKEANKRLLESIAGIEAASQTQEMQTES